MATEFKLPPLGEDITEADVVSVKVSVGDRVEKEQALLEVESDKATLEVPAPAGGTIERINVSTGDTVQVGQVVATLDEAGGGGSGGGEPAQPASAGGGEPAQPASTGGASSTESPNRVPVFAAPSVRTFAREIGVEIHQVAGTGPGGRITLDDVKRHARTHRPVAASSARDGAAAAPTLPDFSQWGPIEREPLPSIRRDIAQHMAASWAAIPHVTLFEKADLTELQAQRKKLATLRDDGGEVSLTAILLKIVAAGLNQYPALRATLDLANQQIIRKHHTHLGVAVDTEHGLLVPVVRDVDHKGVFALSDELADLADRARRRRLQREDMAGGVFTLTNLGGLGTDHFTPLVNYPESGILGVGRAKMEPVWNPSTEAFEPRQRMPLSLAFDHRLTDGADGARLLDWLCRAIANPLLIVGG